MFTHLIIIIIVTEITSTSTNLVLILVYFRGMATLTDAYMCQVLSGCQKKYEGTPTKLEKKPLRDTQNKLHYYCRYVDDTLIDQPTRHTKHPSIQFTYEVGYNKSIAFIDVLLSTRLDGSI